MHWFHASDLFLIFFIWFKSESVVKRKRNCEKRQRVQNELARNGERASWRMNHVCTQSQNRASARSELSASLGPVPGKSNYSKRDRKLLRSRSSLSIYTVYSDQGSWGGNVQRASDSPTSSYPSRRHSRDGGIHTRTTRSFSLILGPTVLFIFSCVPPTQVPRSLPLYLFRATKNDLSRDDLSLSCEIWIMLMCSRIWTLRFVGIRKHVVGDIADNF